MQRSMVIWCTLVVAIGTMRASAAIGQDQNPDPGAVAKRCIESIHNSAERCQKRTTRQTEHCVSQIKTLLADGKTERAEHVARKCVQRIKRLRHASSARLKQRCEHCVRLLHKLGENELAKRVRGACEGSIKNLHKASQHALRTIHKTIQPDSGGGGPDNGGADGS